MLYLAVETWEETGNALRLEAHALLVSSEATHHKLGQSKSKAMTVASEPFRAFHGRVVDIITGANPIHCIFTSVNAIACTCVFKCAKFCMRAVLVRQNPFATNNEAILTGYLGHS